MSISLLISALMTGGALLAAPLAKAAAQADTLRIAFQAASDSFAAGRAANLGVQLGAEEARQTGGMVGRPVALVGPSGESGGDPSTGASVVIGGSGGERCEALLAAAEAATALVLNLGCGADSLRTERHAMLFHVGASDSTYRRSPPGSVLWLPALERYGAAQLNERFAARFGEPMTAPAWAGWMAVKIALEASLRARGTDAAALARALLAPGMRFDGHKGRALSFRQADHQLVQPLYAPGGALEEISP
jgi:hypothetical protein